MIRPLLAATVLALLLGACELTLEVDLPDVEPSLVVNSFFTPDSVWKVHVSDARSLVDGRDAISDLANATVSITVGEGSEILGLEHIGGGHYQMPSDYPQPGISYRLQVDAPNYQAVQAVDAVPEPVAVDFDYVLEEEYDGGESGDRFFTATVELRFRDRPRTPDYYRLFVIQEPWEGEPPRRVYFDLPHGSVQVENPDPDEIGDHDEGISRRDAVFSDGGFDGEDVELTVEFPLGVVSCYVVRPTLDDPEQWDPCVIRVYLLHTSEAFHDYVSTYELHREFSGGDPNADPVRVAGNVENGFGIFAGYNTYSLEMVLPD